MLQITGISLDEEANFHNQAYFHFKPIKTNFALPTMTKPLHNPIFCTKCGKIGHSEDRCSNIPPSAEEIMEIMNRDLSSILFSLNSKEYKYDEYGPYKEDSFDEPVPTEFNFKNSTFCLNCGETGHLANNCPHAKMSRLIFDLGNYFKPDHKISGLDFRNAFQQYW